jgi:hypothetical protein
MNNKLKLILAVAFGYMLGTAITRGVYTEKVLESYDLGWNDANDADKVDPAIEKYKREQERKAREDLEDSSREELVDGPDGWSYKDPAESEPMVTVAAAKLLIEEQGYTSYDKKSEKPTPKPKQPKGETTSSTDLPYLISLFEFDQDERPAFRDHEQYTLTLFEGDNQLVSQADKPIEGKDRVRTVGDLLSRFSGEDAPDSIYIRNPRLKMDFEVVRDSGSYQDKAGGDE